MICLIVAVILIILTTVISVITDRLENIILNLVWILLLIVFLIVGWTASVHTPEMEMKKEDIIENYKRCPCEQHFQQMQNYNSSINYGNNYWCRFKLVDNSEYEIDIDELLSERTETE